MKYVRLNYLIVGVFMIVSGAVLIPVGFIGGANLRGRLEGSPFGIVTGVLGILPGGAMVGTGIPLIARGGKHVPQPWRVSLDPGRFTLWLE